MATPILLALPWLLQGLVLLALIRLPRPLPDPRPREGEGGAGGPGDTAGDGPLVSVIVPARNEAVNILTCLRSLAASTWPAFEIVVVDDRSEDATGDAARAVPRGNARRLVILEGEPLPEGWFGKPWACWQGAREARGELLLFTDADTRHHPELLGRAMAGLEEDGVELLTVAGSQLMEGFWEKVVQPQVFFLLVLRFRNLRDPLAPEDWRRAIANGQYILMARDDYEALGGHEAVKGEVVEDLRLAQVVCRSGGRVSVREGEAFLATRMYRSLAGILEGWTKNLAAGFRHSSQPLPGPLVAAVGVFLGMGWWLAPPAFLAASLLGFGSHGFLLWSSLAVGASLVFWAVTMVRMGNSPLWAVSYPLGAAVLVLLIVRSVVRGERVEWKGRVYGADLPGTPSSDQV